MHAAMVLQSGQHTHRAQQQRALLQEEQQPGGSKAAGEGSDARLGLPSLPLARPDAFEQAFAATFAASGSSGASGGAPANATLAQYMRLVEWLQQHAPLNRTYLAFVPELQSSMVRDVVAIAVRLASMPPPPPQQAAGGDDAELLAALQSAAASLGNASRLHGYPAMRRILLGALLVQRVQRGERFPPAVQQEVDRLLVLLFKLHKQSSAAKGAVQFFHISKSGGTNLCQSAEANGCTSQGFDQKLNCLVKEFIDHPRWVSYSAHRYVQHRLSSRQVLPWFVNFHTYRPPLDCKARRAYLQRNSWTFYANEYTNPPGTDATTKMCSEFVNLIMFRHPLDRLKSQIAWIQKLYRDFYFEVDAQRVFVNRTAGFWERLLPSGANNYYTRSLLGQRYFEYPVVYITHEHVQLAKLAALQHDVLLTLEAKEANALGVRVGLGWTHTLVDSTIRSSSEPGDEAMLPVDYPAMQARNQPDVDVYSFAREMQALDTLLWSFVDAVDEQRGLNSSLRCGYASIDAPEPAPAAAGDAAAAGVAAAAAPAGAQQLPVAGGGAAAAAALGASADAAGGGSDAGGAGEGEVEAKPVQQPNISTAKAMARRKSRQHQRQAKRLLRGAARAADGGGAV